MSSLRFEYKLSSELTQQEIAEILGVLNVTYLSTTDVANFRWKYLENPYGDSLHMIAYDDELSQDSRAVGAMSFWRNDLDAMTPAYQCVELAMLPSHQGRGIFRETLDRCVDRLDGAYLYTFPNFNSQPGFRSRGWSLHRKIPVSVHLPAGLLKEYAKRAPIPDDYAEWRFARNPHDRYFIYRRDGKSFLLAKREKGLFIASGMLSQDFGLTEVRPKILLSCDFPGRLLRLPRKAAAILETPRYAATPGFIPRYRSDSL